MASKKLYIETMGCQMNVLDSELVEGLLRLRGYEVSSDAETADLVLINTCSVRDHAEQKVYSRLGELTKAKTQSPDMVIGIIGCMAERDPDGIFERASHVDLVCGPGELNKLPAMVDEVLETRGRAVALSQSMSRRSTPLERALEFDSVEALDLSRDPAANRNPLQAYVRVQRGCDKFCTYCIVPFTRGPERSRPPATIVDEVKMLAERGTKEIVLVGQTVNSYIHQDDGRAVRFAELLHQVHEVDGVCRIRFVTNYPGDFTDDILEAMRDLPKVCEYLHMPVQSGSNRVLKKMRRQYTVEQYDDLICRMRDIVPGVTVASDFIVGFCDEEEEDHRASCELIERTQFKNIFVFKYSPRPGTAADRSRVDNVSADVKRRRNVEMLKLQERISLANNQSLVGTEYEVLVEGPSKAAAKSMKIEERGGVDSTWRDSSQLVGRTRGDQIVVFNGSARHIGEFTKVRISSVTALTLHGELVE